MYKDKIYCKNCKKISIDICNCKQQNTRYEFKALCPHCLSTNTVNAYIIRLQYEEYNNRGYTNLTEENDIHYINLKNLHKDIQKAIEVFKRFPKHLNSVKDKIDKR